LECTSFSEAVDSFSVGTVEVDSTTLTTLELDDLFLLSPLALQLVCSTEKAHTIFGARAVVEGGNLYTMKPTISITISK
jgi:hypothetical protein